MLLYFYGRLSRNAERYHSVTGKGYRPRPFDLGRGRWIAGAIIIGNFVIVLLLPLLTLLWMSLLPFLRGFSLAGMPSLTLRNYRTVFTAPGYVELALNSLTVAAGAATAIMLITALAGWIAARNGPGGRYAGSARHAVAGVPGHLPRRGGDGSVSARAAADLRLAVDHRDRLCDPLHAVRHALRLFRRAATASGTGGGRRRRRCLGDDDAAADRGALADAGAGGGLAVHLPDRQQGTVRSRCCWRARARR